MNKKHCCLIYFFFERIRRKGNLFKINIKMSLARMVWCHIRKREKMTFTKITLVPFVVLTLASCVFIFISMHLLFRLITFLPPLTLFCLKIHTLIAWGLLVIINYRHRDKCKQVITFIKMQKKKNEKERLACIYRYQDSNNSWCCNLHHQYYATIKEILNYIFLIVLDFFY